MKQVVIAVFLFLLFCCLFISAAGAQPKARKVSVDRKAVKLEYFNKSFEYILKNISKRTGIHFIYKTSVFDDMTTTKIKAADWPTAVSQLLENYSRLEMWSGKLSDSKIWVLEKLLDKNSGSRMEFVRTKANINNNPSLRPEKVAAKTKPAPRLIFH